MAIEFSKAWSRRKNGKVLVSPAAPTRTKTLHRGISVFKEQSQARALGQPVLFQRLKATRELSAPPGTGFSIITRELDTSWWIQVCRQLMRARARRATRRGFPSHLSPIGTTVNWAEKQKEPEQALCLFRLY